MPSRFAAVLVAALLVSPASSHAFFHLADIHEIMSGVNGDPSVQYVEIRMDDAIAQAAVGSTRLTAFSCDGSSFNVLLVVPSNLAIGVLNTEWIMATPNFAAAAGITPDFTW